MYVANQTEHIFVSFPHQTVVVDTSLDSIAGVLLAADCSFHGGLGIFIFGVAGGLQVIIRTWTVIKLARSRT